MRTIITELVWERPSILGEGPIWWNEALYWVDIDAGMILKYSPHDGQRSEWKVGEKVGSIVPRGLGGWILATERGICSFDPDSGSIERLPGPDKVAMAGRFNDGKCDPEGRFFAGTINMEGGASLFRIDPDLTWSCVSKDVSVSNGLCWQGDRFYYIDTPTRRVDVFDYDRETGEIGNRREAFSTKELTGMPDGMTIDANGNLWIAFWGGQCVRCFDPLSGRLLEEIQVPALNVTACWFGGPQLGDLYITTASAGMTDVHKKEFPLSGSLFVARTGASGFPTVPFAG